MSLLIEISTDPRPAPEQRSPEAPPKQPPNPPATPSYKDPDQTERNLELKGLLVVL